MSATGLSDLYIERRLKQADDDSRRVDMLASQGARRHYAIMLACRRLEAVRGLLGDIPRASIDELLSEIYCDLEKANQVRASDEQ